MKNKRKSSVSIIGGADGPTSIFIAGKSDKRPLKVRIKNVCSLSELLTKKPQKNEIKKDTPGYGGKPRKYWGYGGFIKRKISCL